MSCETTYIMTYSTGQASGPVGIAIGDLNNDTRLDIVVANYGSNHIGILFGYGNGSFSNVQQYSTGDSSYPNSVAISDMNNDSRLDIAVVNLISNNIVVFSGDSNKPFGSITTISTGKGSQLHSVAIGDCKNDGRLDIVVANYGTNNVGVFLKRSKMMEYSTGDRSRPYRFVINDMNNDYFLDIVIVNSGTSNIYILYRLGNGTFGDDRSYSLGYMDTSHIQLP